MQGAAKAVRMDGLDVSAFTEHKDVFQSQPTTPASTFRRQSTDPEMFLPQKKTRPGFASTDERCARSRGSMA
eukprot:144417-Rhodomonas_salina.1